MDPTTFKTFAMDTLLPLAEIPNVVANPAPDAQILTDHYRQVYFDTNAVIARVGADMHLPTPNLLVRWEGSVPA